MCLLDFVDICDHETQTEMENHRLVTAHVETAAALVLWFSFFPHGHCNAAVWPVSSGAGLRQWLEGNVASWKGLA